MQKNTIELLHSTYKEKSLSNRYITNSNITPLLEAFDNTFFIKKIGESVLNNSIYGIKLGSGKKKVLMWSQMHGNESTTTKVIFDL